MSEEKTMDALINDMILLRKELDDLITYAQELRNESPKEDDEE